MMEPDASPNPEVAAPKRKRWRLRPALSLRAMMLLVLVAGGWMGWQIQRARAVRRAVRIIEAAGGYVRFAGTRDAAGNPIARPRVAAWLCDTLGEEYVADVEVVSIGEIEPGTDARAVIAAIGALPRVKRLAVAFSGPADKDIAVIAGMADLEEIEIVSEPPHPNTPLGSQAPAPPISPSGLAPLARLRRLRSIRLWLDAGQIDGNALAALSTLPHLRALEIFAGGRMGDAEVQALGGFKHIEELDIRWSRPFEPERTSRPPLPIASWAGLRSLRIWFISLSPDEVRAISHLGKLEILNCSEMGEDHLPLLREMKGLKTLMLDRWQRISRESIESLKAALPGLTVLLAAASPHP